MVACSHGPYAAAMQPFTSGACYAGKVSQLSIGPIYLDGLGSRATR